MHQGKKNPKTLSFHVIPAAPRFPLLRSQLTLHCSSQSDRTKRNYFLLLFLLTLHCSLFTASCSTFLNSSIPQSLNSTALPPVFPLTPHPSPITHHPSSGEFLSLKFTMGEKGQECSYATLRVSPSAHGNRLLTVPGAILSRFQTSGRHFPSQYKKSYR